MTVNVLCVCDYFFPGYLGGGPITTLVNMRKQLRGSEVDFAVFTRDRDLGIDVGYSGIETGKWLGGPDGSVYYARPEEFGACGVRAVLAERPFDLVYLNSFFSAKGSIFPYLAIRFGASKRPVILAPRGEFSPGALAVRRFKKQAFLRVAALLGLYRNVHWHASTTVEAADILRIFPHAGDRIHVAADPVHLEPLDESLRVRKKRPGEVKMVFISRIAPKKNLGGLLEILSLVDVRVQLDIYGPVEDQAYWQRCSELIEALPANVKVSAKGPVAPHEVGKTLSEYDVFAFPTHGENFGHVIFEALSVGTPVILSDQTPWRQDSDGSLTIIPLHDTKGWVEAICHAADRTPEEQRDIRMSSRSYAEKYLSNDESIRDTVEMFARVARS